MLISKLSTPRQKSTGVQCRCYVARGECWLTTVSCHSSTDICAHEVRNLCA